MSNFDQAAGRVKQAAGDLADDDDLKREGKAQETAGKAKDVVDKAKDKADDAIDAVRERLDKNTD
jgi:uncharacterized protein YjbJ (UPF0337 family)